MGTAGVVARNDRVGLFACLFFVSGASGLIYEITWSRMLALVLGGTTFAVTTVLACFMGGLALGSLIAGRRARRLERPARVYGWLEIGIGVYCLAVPALFDLATPLYRGLLSLTGENPVPLTAARVLVSASILLVPTCLMGATLPLLAQAFVRADEEVGRRVGALYGSNTLGAFVGCAAAGFFIVPALGLGGAIRVAAGLNLAVGVVALASWRTARREPVASAPPAAPEPARPTGPAGVLALYAVSGFAAMAYQVAWTRALILSMGSSTYAFSAIVCCYILGLGLGSLIVSAVARPAGGARPGRHALWVCGLLQAGIATSALYVAPLFGRMPAWVAGLMGGSGATFGGVLLAELAIVLGLLALPTLCMGALFPLVVRVAVVSTDPGRGVGRVYAANTVGTIAGALAAGFVLIPTRGIGMQRTIVVASVLSAAIGTVWLLGARRGARSWGPAALLWLLLVAGISLTEPWSRAAMVSGPYLVKHGNASSVLYYREGVDTTVAVTSTGGTDRTMRVNGKPDASNVYADMVTQLMLGHLPMLLHPDATRVLVIGLGAGVTAGAMLGHPVETLDVAEISDAVIEAAGFFEDVNNGVLSDPRATILRADGRNHLLLSDRRYDVISVEPSNPWISGVANLFTREAFELARARLRPGGLYCHWLQGYAIRGDDFASVLRTLDDVFPYTQLWEGGFGDYLVLGSETPIEIDLDRIYLAMSRREVAASLASAMIQDPLQLAQHWIGDREALRGWTADKPVLRDDRPYLEFSAPRSLLTRDESGVRSALIEHTARPRLPDDAPRELADAFGRIADRNRARLEAISGFETASQTRDAGVALESMTLLAGAGATDGRAMMRLAELVNTVVNESEQGVAERALATVERLQAELPYLASFQELAAGGAARPPWPFSRHFPHEQDPRVADLEQQIRDGITARDGEQVERLARRLLELAPDSWRALATLGALRLENDGPEAARSLLLAAWIRNPGSRTVAFRLAQVYARLGRTELSREYARRAVDNGTPAERLAADPLLAPLVEPPRPSPTDPVP